MNNIYDFYDIERIHQRQRRLIIGYVTTALLFAVLLIAIVVGIKNNLLATLIFAFTLLFFLLASIVFWKIKYAALAELKSFLDKMEMGNKSECVGVFLKKECSPDEPHDRFIFAFSGEESVFLVHKGADLKLLCGEKYHIEHVGCYMLRWKEYEA